MFRFFKESKELRELRQDVDNLLDESSSHASDIEDLQEQQELFLSEQDINDAIESTLDHEEYIKADTAQDMIEEELSDYLTTDDVVGRIDTALNNRHPSYGDWEALLERVKKLEEALNNRA